MPEFEPRRATAGERFHFTGRDGEQHKLEADDKGVVRPKDAEEVEILDGFDLPVARKVLAAERKAEAAAAKEAEEEAAKEAAAASDSADTKTEADQAADTKAPDAGDGGSV